ncbi:MAG: M20/M25/M40 family metallo-hydrolase, partial [Bryobacteraceae bacterium]
MRKGVVWSSAMAAVIALAIPLAAQQMQKETIDYTALYQLKQEALGNSSQVMKTLSFISDVYGGRLTGSTNAKLAADWSVKALESWGLSNVHLEPWEFGRGWVNERFSANVTSPVTYPLIGAALAWTPGTNGTINADAMIATIANEGDFAKYAGKLKGKIVLLTPARVIAMSTEPLAHRYTDAELAEIAEEPVSGNPRPASGAFQPDIATLREQFRAAREFRPKLMKFLVDEGVAAVFSEGSGDGGTFHAQSGGSYSDNTPAPTQVVLAAEHYNRIYRTIEDGVPVSVELNVQNKFLDGDRNSFDIIAEIPGSDPALADQVVMIGGHFDSWQSGTGATDNGVGSAVMMEVMRVLKASGLKFRRTIRLGLWTGEEEGLLGSRAYVAQHFGDRNTMQLKP